MMHCDIPLTCPICNLFADKPKPNWSAPSGSSSSTPLDYKTATPTSSHKFSILHKVVEYLKVSKQTKAYMYNVTQCLKSAITDPLPYAKSRNPLSAWKT